MKIGLRLTEETDSPEDQGKDREGFPNLEDVNMAIFELSELQGS